MIFGLSTLISFKGDSRFIYVVLYLFTDNASNKIFISMMFVSITVTVTR